MVRERSCGIENRVCLPRRGLERIWPHAREDSERSGRQNGGGPGTTTNTTRGIPETGCLCPRTRAAREGVGARWRNIIELSSKQVLRDDRDSSLGRYLQDCPSLTILPPEESLQNLALIRALHCRSSESFSLK